VCAVVTVGVILGLAPLYMSALSQDDVVIDLGVSFLWWVAPGYALLFPMTVLSATFRGIGIVTPPMLIFTLTVILDGAFAIVLIPGLGFIPALGVEGAGLATTLSFAFGSTLILAYFRRTEPDIAIRRKLLAPQFAVWRRILAVGSPAAAELTLMFLMMSAIYIVIRNEGASAQAGFGIGFRILSLLVLPGLAISLAAAPIAGQNFGAGNYARVREVFRTSGVLSTAVMIVVTILVLWQPQALLNFFETDTASAETAASFLQLMAWTLVAQGLVYTCAFMFQALGNTMPALLSAVTRFVIFSLPALWLSYQPSFHTDQVWVLLTASIAIQAAVSLWLLQIEFKRKLQPIADPSNDQRTTSDTLASPHSPDERLTPLP
jgi:putative MATE family efflux protein